MKETSLKVYAIFFFFNKNEKTRERGLGVGTVTCGGNTCNARAVLGSRFVCSHFSADGCSSLCPKASSVGFMVIVPPGDSVCREREAPVPGRLYSASLNHKCLHLKLIFMPKQHV